MDNLQRVRKLEPQFSEPHLKLKLKIQMLEEQLKMHLLDSKKKITLHTQNEIYVVSIDDIIRCESKGNYTQYNLLGGRKILTSKTLKWSQKLIGNTFIRIHQSHLINVDHISKIFKTNGTRVVLTDGIELPVSRSYKKSFFNYIN